MPVTCGSRNRHPTTIHGAPWHDILGVSLSAQAQYAAGIREILECYVESRQTRIYPTLADVLTLLSGGTLFFKVMRKPKKPLEQ